VKYCFMNREKHLGLLSELIKNSRQTDRNLAKILGMSQPSVTRNRKTLEREVIRQYTAIPNLTYLDFEIAALTFFSTRNSLQAFTDKVSEWTEKQPSVLFASTGQGIESTAFMVSVHKDYTSFAKFQHDFRTECSEHLQDHKTFILSPKADIILKHFSLNSLVEASRNPL